MIVFKDITLEGFGSYINETKFTLDRPGLNIIIGLNGAGKTHIPSAISWVLFGKALKETKDVSTWPHLRPKDFKGTKVTLRFNDYELVRYKDYKLKGIDGIKGANRIVLWDGEKNILTANKIGNQETLNAILGFNYEVLVSSIIFGQRMKRLIENSGPDKKRVFEEAFNASFIKDAKDKAAKDLDHKKFEYGTLESQLGADGRILEAQISMFKQQKQLRKSALNNQQERLTNLHIELKALQSNTFKENIEKKITKLEKEKLYLLEQVKESRGLQTYYSQLMFIVDTKKAKSRNLLSSKESLSNDFQSVNDSLSHYQSDESDITCETCGSKIKDLRKAKLIKDLKERAKILEDNLYEIETEIFSTAASIESTNKEAEEVKKSISEPSGLEEDINHLEAKIKSLEKENFKKSMNDEYIRSCYGRIGEAEKVEIPTIDKKLKAKIEELQESIATNSVVRDELKKEAEDLSWLVNDLLGNKGLKAYIFESMLQKLNHLLVYYEQFIGFRVEFKVDLNSGNKDIYAICYRGDHLIFYEDLSGGQKQLVDAVTTFAMYDLISKDKPTNLLFFDEPFESLSGDNIEIVYDLINDKAKGNRSIYLITHQLDLQNASTKVIRMSLGKDGSTKLKTL